MSDGSITIRLKPQYINYVNRIFEGYEYLGVVSTISKQEGIVVIRATPDTKNEVLDILAHLDLDFDYVDGQK